MSASTAATGGVESSVVRTNSARKAIAPPDTANEVWIRRLILAAFWVIVVAFGLPHWIWTTSVYRAELDVGAASRWIEGKACSFQYPIYISVEDERPSDSIERIEFSNALLETLNSQNTGLYRWQAHESESTQPPAFTIKLQASSHTSATASLDDWGSNVVVHCPRPMTENAITNCAAVAVDSVLAATSNERAAIAHVLRNSAYSELVSHDAEDVAELEKRSTRAFKYASSYHITFSLFSASSAPSAWDIEHALQQYLNPLLDSLSSISNFTVDTQVQLLSSFSPSMEGPHYNEDMQAWTLSRTDLSGFINAAEWPLSPSIDSGPTINLVLYVPAADKMPLLVEDSTTNSWVIPQWGGVQILNRAETSELTAAELEPIMYAFADQLTALVGLPRQPASLRLRINALTRERIAALIVSASDTLGALVRLTQKLEQIAIPQSVAQAVSSSVSDLEMACHNLEAGRYEDALTHARLADEAVEKAFFEPSMVGQVYFPDEHKVAVYVPLLGPMAVPLLMATIKEIRDFRQRKVKVN
ncbi:hypothetical protein AMS68_002754 [Peltaster fructicola]|uniref:GPI transamidase component PIG-S n=1 Tax=Peltaster fructicola TaxID=286661 RepID=A0A6H0XR52_9PEZI|nr:hypothetical protein AMS68_002754 [Peltaster fructicola]